MIKFFWDGRGLPFGQGDKVTQLRSEKTSHPLTTQNLRIAMDSQPYFISGKLLDSSKNAAFPNYLLAFTNRLVQNSDHLVATGIHLVATGIHLDQTGNQLDQTSDRLILTCDHSNQMSDPLNLNGDRSKQKSEWLYPFSDHYRLSSDRSALIGEQLSVTSDHLNQPTDQLEQTSERSFVTSDHLNQPTDQLEQNSEFYFITSSHLVENSDHSKQSSDQLEQNSERLVSSSDQQKCPMERRKPSSDRQVSSSDRLFSRLLEKTAFKRCYVLFANRASKLFGKPLAFLRHSFGTGSEHGRGFFDYCSTGLRLLFDKQSKDSRSVPEGQPNLSRSSFEQVSKNSRTALEAESKKGDALLACEVKVSVGRQKAQFGSLFSPQPPKGGTEADNGKAVHSCHNKWGGANAQMSRTGQVLVKQMLNTYIVLIMYRVFSLIIQIWRFWSVVISYSWRKAYTKKVQGDCTSSVRLMYCECTIGVLLVYWKGAKKVLRRYYRGTRKVLRRYQRGTIDLRAVCTSVVLQLASKVGVRGNCALINRVCVDCVNKWVPAICRRLSRRHPSRCIGTGNHDGNIKGELLSKLRAYSLQLRARIKPIAYGVQLTAMILLFSSVALAQSPELSGAAAGHKTIPYDNPTQVKRLLETQEFDIERYPWMKYEVDATLIPKVSLGDAIPDDIMDMPLWVVGRDTPSDTLNLRELTKNRLVILDFWTSWCSPCVASMVKWESYIDSLEDKVYLLGVHLDFDYKARPFIQKMGWDSQSVIGLHARVLNRAFFDRSVISRMAWIMDGKLIAITATTGFDLQMVRDLIDGEAVDIPMAQDWTYSQLRY